MDKYCVSMWGYERLITKEVNIGGLLLGNGHPIRLQTMTTTDTMDTEGTIAQAIRCFDAGAELVRITAPSKNEAHNLLNIRNGLRAKGYNGPLVADIHFTPNAAEIAARIVEKVRVNPGNYVDKKKFDLLEYTDAEYAEEIERIRNRFAPLVAICKEYGTAMRIGTNHGSLSDRIMGRYGDTPIGMVESAMEFLRIARDENYHNIVLSMKSSNPQVMVQAYRLLVNKMLDEFGEAYPLHLGVTEAGDGEDGRIKSALGIGTLLEDGIGDTVRVSLTEDPELEIPVCKDIVKRYERLLLKETANGQSPITLPSAFSPFQHRRRETRKVGNIGGGQVPVVVADLSKCGKIERQTLASIGYAYDALTDKWNIGDQAADYMYVRDKPVDFALPGTLAQLVEASVWQLLDRPEAANIYPIFDSFDYVHQYFKRSDIVNFVAFDCCSLDPGRIEKTKAFLMAVRQDPTVVVCLYSLAFNALQSVRGLFMEMMNENITAPVVLMTDSRWKTPDEHLVEFATETGGLFIDGFGDGICLGLSNDAYDTLIKAPVNTQGRNYLEGQTVEAFLNATAFSILQAARVRISKTEYISCPSCGRTLFDLQETTAKIRSVTHHLKGVKIAIMGCIVNGPGEMADADFGYVGSGPGKITLYKGKEVVKKNIESAVAVDELIALLKEHGAWQEKTS